MQWGGPGEFYRGGVKTHDEGLAGSRWNILKMIIVNYFIGDHCHDDDDDEYHYHDEGLARSCWNILMICIVI